MKRHGIWLLCALAAISLADDGKVNVIAVEGYTRPTKELEEAVTAPWYRNTGVSNLSPDRTRYIVSESAGLPKLADLARPYLNLGGVQVDPRATRARSAVFRRTNSFQVKALKGSQVVTIPAPKGTSVASPEWSPNGEKIAFIAHSDTGSSLWVADARTGKSKLVSKTPLNAVLEGQYQWLKDSKTLVAVFVPQKRTAPPAVNEVATGPLVKVSDDKTNSIRTYAGLMNSPIEFDLLEWHATGQLGMVDVDSGRLTTVGQPAMIRNVSAQPDGTHFRVTLMERPFSYMVPASSFPSREILWNAKGEQVLEISKQALRFGTPPTPPASDGDAKRSLGWLPNGAGMGFLQVTSAPSREPSRDDSPEGDEQGRGGRFGGGAQGGATALRPGQKDRLIQWLPPYTDKDMKVVWESDQRIGSIQYSEDMATIFVTQTVGGRSQTAAIRLSEPTKRFKVVESVTGDNAFYEDPGSLMTRQGNIAGSVVRMSDDGKFVYLSGTKYFKDPNKDAPRSFIDRVEIETGKKERIFEADPAKSASASLIDDNGKELLVVEQSPTSISQTYLVGTNPASRTQLTANRDYAPDITGARRQRLTVTRNDGIKFEVELTLPPDAKPGAKLPAFFWFYPSEYTDQAAYDRSKRTFNKNSFNNVSPTNKALLLRAGYVLVEPDCPIIGADTRKNDGYVPQLRNNLAATIDAICEDGTVDRNRLGIGGHSYGAFSTLNAMVHTPYFKAGIAGDGNYNRLLTPFGFQSEQRQLWESRETYLSMSPMLYLEQLTGAVLLYHGIDDQNMGTDPINSPKMFAALEALGKNAALYMYPYEDHGQIAEETVLDQWARFVAWLDKYVKGAK